MALSSALLSFALPALILVAWAIDRRDHFSANDKLTASFDRERLAWQDERRELLNRIKPETAQYAAPADDEPAPQVRFDDDEAYWDSLDVLARLSKDELADVSMNAERGADAPPLTAPEPTE